MINNNNLTIKVVFLLLGIIFLINFVGAVECGSTPTNGCDITQNTTFIYGNYTLVNGVNLMASNITLDCSGSTLIGSGFVFSGINVLGNRDSNIIKNCNVEGYISGVFFNRFIGSEAPNDNRIVNNSFRNNTYGVYFRSNSNHNLVLNNSFKNNSQGIQLEQDSGYYPTYNNITGNNFISSLSNDIFLKDNPSTTNVWSNNIWGNTIRKSIRYTHTGLDNYVIDGVENVYLNDSTGPTLEGIHIYQGLIVNTNRTYKPGNYNFSGILTVLSVQSGGIIIDCNNSINISGSRSLFSTGIRFNLYNDASNSQLKNCNIKNFDYGVKIEEDPTGGNPSNILIINNTIENSAEGIIITGDTQGFKILNNRLINNSNGISLDNQGGNPNLHNISLNLFKANGNGVFIESGSNLNSIFNNNFLDNSASDSGSSNNFNFTEYGGNYWNNYDSVPEGCINSNNDQFCDNPYNISGTANNKDYKPYIVQDGWLLGPQVGTPIPIQVIVDVDMVKGKTTLIRIPITFTSVLSNDTITPNVTVYWNGTFVSQNLTTTFIHNQSKNIDFWYVPQNAGDNLPIVVTVSGTSVNEINYSDANSKSVDVMKTRNLSLTFVSVDNPYNFDSTPLDAMDFIYKTYPLKNNGIIYQINKTNIYSTNSEHNRLGIHKLLYRIHKSTYVSGKLPERSVGVLPVNWFYNNLGAQYATTVGYSKPLYHNAILVQEDFGDFFDHVSAHELGHTYGLCDEYSEDDWNKQDGFFLNLCPNGDLDNDGSLDSICEPGGCPTSTLEPLSGQTDSKVFGNFMGRNVTSNLWIAKDSYEHLLNEFSHESPEFQQQRVVIGGIVNRTNNSSVFDQFYTIGSGLALNLSEYTSGNYSIEAYINNSLTYKFYFNISFIDIFFGGNTSENNETSFVFTLPYYSNITSFVLKENNLTKNFRNVSFNNPMIDIISTLGEQTYSNQEIFLNWSASDLDGGTLSYAVLFSSDGGINYNAIIFDHNQTWFNLSSNDLEDGNSYKVKVIVTDGVRTNESVMNATFEIDNDLQIKNFSIVYQNSTERIFKIALNNTLSQSINDITWEFDSGQGIKTSQYNINLGSSEETLFFIYHNYTTSGNYNVSFKAQSGIFRESEYIQINV